MALKFRADSDVAWLHCPLISVCGVSLAKVFMVNRRNAGLSAFKIISLAFNIGDELPRKAISILDCPEQNHTSPIITFLRINFSPSLNQISYGPPAVGVATFNF